MQGDPTGDRWLRDLRRHLLDLATRRVGADHAEDVVQATLQIIVERGVGPGVDTTDGLPPLAWCFQVLRNVIGNHYQRERTRRRVLDDGKALEELPVAAPLATSERLRALESTLDEIARTDAPCGELLRRTVEGHSPQEIADATNTAIGALYQRLYRCRRRLREMLRERGVLT